MKKLFLSTSLLLSTLTVGITSISLVSTTFAQDTVIVTKAKKIKIVPRVDRVRAIEETMKWFNYIADLRNPFKKSDLEKYFSPHFVMRMNGKIKVNNYDSLYNHFEKFRQSGLLIQVQLPFEETVEAKNNKKLVTKYILYANENGVLTKTIWDMAIWTFAEDNRIEKMDEVAFIEEIVKKENPVFENEIYREEVS